MKMPKRHRSSSSMANDETHSALPDLEPEPTTSGVVENPNPEQHARSDVKGERRPSKPAPSRVRPIHAALLQDPVKVSKATRRNKTHGVVKPRLPVAARSKRTSTPKSGVSGTNIPSRSHSADSEEPDNVAVVGESVRSNLAEATFEPQSSSRVSKKSMRRKIRRRSQTFVPNIPAKRKIKSEVERVKYKRTNVSMLGIGSKNRSLISGLWADLFMITSAYSRCKSTSFKDFLHLCQEKQIMSICRGFRGLSRLLEFTELAISRCRDMWLERVLSLKRQVSWFYLLCVFVVYQPRALIDFDERTLKIRVTESDWKIIQEFLLIAHASKFTDVLTLFKLLYDKEAFLYCFTRSTYGLESPFVQSFLKDTEKTEYLFEDVPFPRLAVGLQPHREQLGEVLKEYSEMKSNLMELSSPEIVTVLSELLGNVTPNFVDELFDPLKATPIHEPDDSLQTE